MTNLTEAMRQLLTKLDEGDVIQFPKKKKEFNPDHLAAFKDALSQPPTPEPHEIYQDLANEVIDYAEAQNWIFEEGRWVQPDLAKSLAEEQIQDFDMAIEFFEEHWVTGVNYD